MFTVSDTAKTHLVFCKETANERKESLLLISRMQHIFCKDIANERKESLLLISRMQHIFCKDTAKCEQNKIKSFIFLKSIRFDCAAMSVIRLVCIYMEQVFRYHQLMTMLQYLWKVFVFLLSRFLTGVKNKKVRNPIVTGIPDIRWLRRQDFKRFIFLFVIYDFSYILFFVRAHYCPDFVQVYLIIYLFD